MMGIPTVKNNKTNYSTIKHSEIMGSNHCCENTAASFVANLKTLFWDVKSHQNKDSLSSVTGFGVKGLRLKHLHPRRL